MAKRKKDSDKSAVEETIPEVLTSAESEETPPEETPPEETPPEEPKEEKPKEADKAEVVDLVRVKAAEYLKQLGAKPAESPKPRVDKRAGKRPPPPGQPEPWLTARQFVRARRQRWERCAGFLLEMKRKLGPEARLTMLEWQPLWDAFWTRPVGGLRRR